VRAVAGRYRGLGLSDDDLFQEGALGLLDAVDHFDAGRGRFEPYARFCIRRAIRNALPDTSRVTRLPKQLSDGDVGDEVVRADQELRVDALVGDLPPRQREIVERHFGLSCRAEPISAVAQSLHISEQRSRAIDREALAVLRDELDPR